LKHMPHGRNASWFLNYTTTACFTDVQNNTASLASDLPNGDSFAELVSNHCGWPSPQAMSIISGAGADHVALIKPDEKHPRYIPTSLYNTLTADGTLDYFDTWDPFAHNVMKHPQCSQDRNFRHNAIGYELGLQVEHAGGKYDTECRRLLLPAGLNNEPPYKPDGVTCLPVPFIMKNAKDDEYYRDIGISDTVQPYIVETKGVATYDAGLYTHRETAVDHKAAAVKRQITKRFSDNLCGDLLEPFTVVPAVVGAYNELSKPLHTFVLTLAMLVAVRESRAQGSDMTQNTTGDSIRYRRYLELSREFVLRIQIAAGLAQAQLPASVALRTKSLVGGAGIADHAQLANPTGSYMNMDQTRRMVLGQRRALNLSRQRAAGARRVPTAASREATEYLRALSRDDAHNKARKPKKPPTCSMCHAQGHRAGANACTKKQEWLDRRQAAVNARNRRQDQQRPRPQHSRGEGDVSTTGELTTLPRPTQGRSSRLQHQLNSDDGGARPRGRQSSSIISAQAGGS